MRGMEKLLDRAVEISQLEAAWERAQAGAPQLALVWGRRRVGKTFLLSHFTRGRRAIFFGATQQAEAVELRRLAEAVARGVGQDTAALAGGGFPDWESALRFLAALAKSEPLLVVLDEVPYLTASTKGFPSIVQAVWDHLPRQTKLMLVLTGSAVGMMERMLGAGGALRGRPTLSLRMDPLDMMSARVFLPHLKPAAFMEAYAACGGYPLHLRAWDPTQDTASNLVALAATTGGVLVEDATGILREELPDAGGYARILAAIGRGRTRMSEIANEAAQRVEHPLDILTTSGFVRRSVPVGAPKRARPLYEFADAYLAFWFGVLYSDLALIAAGQGAAVLKRRNEQWQRHLGWVFEEAARAHAIRLVTSGRLPSDMVLGRWWSSTGEPCEVDVLGLRGSETHLLGEARWQERPLGANDLRRLEAKRHRVPDIAGNPIFALWGRSGADRDIRGASVRTFDIGDVLAP